MEKITKGRKNSGSKVDKEKKEGSSRGGSALSALIRADTAKRSLGRRIKNNPLLW